MGLYWFAVGLSGNQHVLMLISKLRHDGRDGIQMRQENLSILGGIIHTAGAMSLGSKGEMWSEGSPLHVRFLEKSGLCHA